jgi:uncharacterized protein involved in exopolysaccharide biosynthesis
MLHATHPFASPKQFIRTLWTYRLRWIIPTVVVGVLATAYALVLHRPTWQASTALVVRDAAQNGADYATRAGRFTSVADQKSAQVTALELARSKPVISAALEEAGPAAKRGLFAFASFGRRNAFPDDDSIDDLRKAISVTPPNGEEFGMADVFLLRVKSSDRHRAVVLADALVNQLEIYLQQTRDQRAQSLIDELAKSVRLAQADLDEATAQLAKLEAQVGSNLGELRSLGQLQSGDSDLRRARIELENEIRRTRSDVVTNRQLLELLEAAQSDPDQLLATPSRLLDGQPALRQLKQGVVDAQIATAKLSGMLNEAHPRMIEALDAENEIRRDLHDELDAALLGVRSDLELNERHLDLLESQLASINERLAGLAAMRAQYNNLVTLVSTRTDILVSAEKNLAEARANKAGATAASVVTRLTGPDTGQHPVGLTRRSIALLGAAAGLLLGLGIVFLTVENVESAAAVATETANETATEGAAGVAETAPAPVVQETNGRSPGARNGKPVGGVSGKRGLNLKEALLRIAPAALRS